MASIPVTMNRLFALIDQSRLAINPQYYRGPKQLLIGDDKLVLSEIQRTFCGKGTKTTVLNKDEGLVTNIKWNSSFVAWANSKGVKIYDILARRRVTFIPFSIKTEAKLQPHLYKCNMCWKNDSTLLIGWGNEVKVCEIRTRQAQDPCDLPMKYVLITQMFTTDYFICGIAPFSDSNIVLLTYSEPVSDVPGEAAKNQRPHVRLEEPGMLRYNEKSNDALGIKGYEKYQCHLYTLEWVRNEDIYFIISPSDVIVAKPRTEDDRVEWLLGHDKFEEALKVLKEKRSEVKRYKYDAVGHQYLDYLCERGEYERAACQSVELLGKSKDAWENHFFKFRQHGQVKVIERHLPKEDPRLSPVIYELVLYDFLHSNVIHFHQMLELWDPEIYSSHTLVNATLELVKSGDLPSEEMTTLYQCLALLYTNQHLYADALTVYLRLKNNDIFLFIHKHNLFNMISDRILALMTINRYKAMDLFLANIELISPQQVVDQLEEHPRLQLLYLERLMNQYLYECTSYHTKMIGLYATYKREQLLPFLKETDGYDLTAAITFCEERRLEKELIYLIGRAGNHRQALQMIITQLQDVKYAIDFCREYNYDWLWKQLSNHLVIR